MVGRFRLLLVGILVSSLVVDSVAAGRLFQRLCQRRKCRAKCRVTCPATTCPPACPPVVEPCNVDWSSTDSVSSPALADDPCQASRAVVQPGPTPENAASSTPDASTQEEAKPTELLPMPSSVTPQTELSPAPIAVPETATPEAGSAVPAPAEDNAPADSALGDRYSTGNDLPDASTTTTPSEPPVVVPTETPRPGDSCPGDERPGCL